VLLVSAPYALKAGDAETIGGLPPSAFMLAAPPNNSASTAVNNVAPTAGINTSPGSLTTSDVTTTGGTVGTIPVFATATSIQNALLTQTGTTAINVKGILNLPATGTATASAGKNSQPQTLATSAFNSSTSAAVAQTFQWQAEPAGNDTSTPSGALHLLFGSGTSKPSETGLNIAGNGQITFAKGQTFPGTGNGTITGVTAGTDLTGGGTSGSVTLNVDTTKIPQLGGANTFVGNQAITGNLTDTGNITATGSLSAATETITNTASGVALNVSSPNAFTGMNVSGGTAVHATGYNTGVYATATTASNGVGVSAVTSNGTAVQGQDTGSGSTSTGVLGLSVSPTGVGVVGEANNASISSQGIGVVGSSASPTGIGVEGESTASSGSFGIGVLGIASNYAGTGIEGVAGGVGGDGGYFTGGPPASNISAGSGVYAVAALDATSEGYGGGAGGNFGGGISINGPAGNGVYAQAGSGVGQSNGFPVAGVFGIGPSSHTGSGPDGAGVFGNDVSLSSTGSAFLGEDIGVWGDVSQAGGSGLTPIGLLGTADNALAVFAQNNGATYPVCLPRIFPRPRPRRPSKPISSVQEVSPPSAATAVLTP
jgi:hypothetical protein